MFYFIAFIVVVFLICAESHWYTAIAAVLIVAIVATYEIFTEKVEYDEDEDFTENPYHNYLDYDEDDGEPICKYCCSHLRQEYIQPKPKAKLPTDPS